MATSILPEVIEPNCVGEELKALERTAAALEQTLVNFRAQMGRLSDRCRALEATRGGCCVPCGGARDASCSRATGGELPTHRDIATKAVPTISNGVHRHRHEDANAEKDTPAPPGEDRNTGNPLSANMTVLRTLVGFVGGESYLFFAPVSKAWLSAWIGSSNNDGKHQQRQRQGKQQPCSSCSSSSSSSSPSTSLTRAITVDTTPSQLSHCFDCGLREGHPRICQALAALGRLDLLPLARAHGCPLGKATSTRAALGGHLEVLRWAHANGCPLTTSTCAAAAAGGHLGVLQWARANGCPWDASTCSVAALRGRLGVLRWALANRCPCNDEACARAAEAGHLEVLRWARANGCPWTETTCASAAGAGRLHMLQWARRNGCPWDKDTCAAAAVGGHLSVLQWARENGCPWEEGTCLNMLFEFGRRQQGGSQASK